MCIRDRPSGGEYIGLRRYGNRVVFEYQIGQTKISDEPWASKSGFYRRIDFSGLSGKLELPCPIGNGYQATVVQAATETNAEWKDGKLSLSGQSQQGSLILKISAKGNSSPDPEVIAHLNSPRKISKRWNEVLNMPGKLGGPKVGANYVIDTLSVPYDNPYKTVMQLTG